MSERTAEVAVLDPAACRYAPLVGGAPAFSDPDALLAGFRDAEVLLADPSLAAHVVGRLPRLRWVQSTWAGVEPLVGEGLPRDYLLTRAVDVFGPQMAEFVLAYLLLVTRRILPRLEDQRTGRWREADHETLAGRALGILGTGSIGSTIARAAGCLGMRVLGCNSQGRPAAGFDEVFGPDQRLEVAARSDHLVAVLPSTRATHHFVDGELLAGLHPGGVVVNVGRGSTVDTRAVVAALRAGHLRAAVLDVLEQEPLPPDDPLWHEPGVFITSHTAGVSRPEEIVPLFLDNLDRFDEGRPLRGLVDFERGY